MVNARIGPERQRLGEYAALNDIVITKSAMSRIIDLAVSVEGQHATSYRADGLIISTHTARSMMRRSEEHTSELQSQFHLVCRLLLEKKKKAPSKLPLHCLTE